MTMSTAQVTKERAVELIDEIIAKEKIMVDTTVDIKPLQRSLPQGCKPARRVNICAGTGL